MDKSRKVSSVFVFGCRWPKVQSRCAAGSHATFVVVLRNACSSEAWSRAPRWDDERASMSS